MISTLQQQDPETKTPVQWGMTLDIKNFFHHLQIHPKLQRWMRFQVGNRGFQIQALPFGWALSPWWAQKLTKPIRAWLNEQQIPHCWYVDDILILGATAQLTADRTATL
eukprot:EG_transcript_15985